MDDRLTQNQMHINKAKEREAIDALYQASARINQRLKELDALYHAAALRSGIRDGEINIWSMLLCSNKEYSQQELAEMFYLSKQTANSIVGNLVKKGYVVLEHVPGTRNRKVIRLTEAGRTFGEKHVLWIFEAEQRALEGSEIKEVQAYISMIERYTSRLREELEAQK